MAVELATIQRGFSSGVRLVGEVGKVLLPTAVLVTLLDRSGWLQWLAGWLAPAMGVFGLPGQAALALVVGNLVTFQAGVAVLAALHLPVREATIAAAMLMTCHSVITDSALLARAGARLVPVVSVRLLASAAAGLLLHLLLGR